jgi:hypothetical protein
MNERATDEVPFDPARGGHRGRDSCARVRDDPSIGGAESRQRCGGQEAERAIRIPAERRLRSALARMDDYDDASSVT